MSSGVKEQDAINFMEKEQKKRRWELEEDEVIKLAILTLQTVIGQEFKSNDIEIGVVSAKNPKFTKLNAERIEFYLNEVSKKDWVKCYVRLECFKFLIVNCIMKYTLKDKQTKHLIWFYLD